MKQAVISSLVFGQQKMAKNGTDKLKWLGYFINNQITSKTETQ